MSDDRAAPDAPSRPLSIVVAAPFGEDAKVLAGLVLRQAAACEVRGAENGIPPADALLLTQEALHTRFLDDLCAFYLAEPVWSAPPLVILVDAVSVVAEAVRRLRHERPNLNVALLHRPCPAEEIAAALATAMAARRDQFRLRDEIAAHHAAERRVEFLLNELQHRVKNMFGIIAALGTQTFRTHHDSAQDFSEVFSGRLQGLANAYEVLSAGGFRSVGLADLAQRVVGPLAPPSAAGSLVLEGPSIRLSTRAADALGLTLHELAANAAKYGAFSTEGGRVSLTWHREPDAAVLTWTERGGPTVTPPAQRGFGSTVIERMFARQTGGAVDLRFAPEGVECVLRCPLPRDG